MSDLELDRRLFARAAERAADYCATFCSEVAGGGDVVWADIGEVLDLGFAYGLALAAYDAAVQAGAHRDYEAWGEAEAMLRTGWRPWPMTPVAYAASMARGESPAESITSAAANRAWSAYYATGSWQAAFEQLAAEEDAS